MAHDQLSITVEVIPEPPHLETSLNNDVETREQTPEMIDDDDNDDATSVCLASVLVFASPGPGAQEPREAFHSDSLKVRAH